MRLFNKWNIAMSVLELPSSTTTWQFEFLHRKFFHSMQYRYTVYWKSRHRSGLNHFAHVHILSAYCSEFLLTLLRITNKYCSVPTLRARRTKYVSLVYYARNTKMNSLLWFIIVQVHTISPPREPISAFDPEIRPAFEAYLNEERASVRTSMNATKRVQYLPFPADLEQKIVEKDNIEKARLHSEKRRAMEEYCVDSRGELLHVAQKKKRYYYTLSLRSWCIWSYWNNSCSEWP